MNKHQTLVYIKYGKLISEINDIIADHDIKNDMIKFLVKFPGNLIYPNDIYLSINKTQGRFIFEITKLIPSKFISIYFDGINNFKICTYGINNLPIYPYNEWPFNNITWSSIDNIERYVELYHNDFNDIIEYNE